MLFTLTGTQIMNHCFRLFDSSRLRSFILLILSLSLIGGCQQQKKNTEEKPSKIAMKQPLPKQEKISDELKSQVKPVNKNKPMKKTILMHLKGTVKYLNLEGGFFGIITEKGEKILPIKMKAPVRALLKEGSEINFTGAYVKNIRTIQQWGRPFEIITIHVVKEGKNSTQFQKM